MAQPRLRAYDYPWSPVDGPVLLSAHGTRELGPGWSDGAASFSLAGRSMVIAVGSNRSPDVLSAKLAGVPGEAVMIPARMSGLGVGHSAHVSRRGYLAAAPYDAPGSEVSITVLWLTAEQLGTLDETEPNYDRIALDPSRYSLRDCLPFPLSSPPDDKAGAAPAQIYATRWGLLAPDGVVLGLTSQARLQAMLLEVEEIRAILIAVRRRSRAATPDAHDQTRLVPGPELCVLLADDAVRTRVTALLGDGVGARAAGLVAAPTPVRTTSSD